MEYRGTTLDENALTGANRTVMSSLFEETIDVNDRLITEKLLYTELKYDRNS